MKVPQARPLTIEEIERIAAQFKEDLTRECDRAARRHDNDSPFVSYAAVMAKDYLDKFLYSLKLRAGSQLHTLLRPPRARAIHLSPKIINRK